MNSIQLCNTGVTRFVILFNRHVIKFPRIWWSWRWFLIGLLSNLSERHWWKMTKDQRLCPVLFSDPFGLLLIMPRCDRIKAQEIPDLENLSGIPLDYKYENFGKINNQILLIDYGSAYWGNIYKHEKVSIK